MKENNKNELKRAETLLKLIISKKLINNNYNIEAIKNDSKIKEKIDNYFKYIRMDIINMSYAYNLDTNEDFLLDILDSIFSDSELLLNNEKVRVSYKDLLDICGENYKEDFFINPIKAFKETTQIIDKLYKEAYEANGIKGIEYIYKSLPIVINNKYIFNINELSKVTDSQEEELIIINNLLLKTHNIENTSNSKEFCDSLLKAYKRKKEDEERRIFWSIKK